MCWSGASAHGIDEEALNYHSSQFRVNALQDLQDTC